MASAATISFASEAGVASGYLVRPGPRFGAPTAGIVVIQEWWGLVPHIKDIANRFAAEGYVALAPDLYHGKSTVEAAEAQHLLEGLDWGRAAKELAGAVRHLREKQGVQRVGVVGFCMGGALTIIAAANPGVNAYVAFYGFPPKAALPEQIAAPGLIFFGEKEEYFSAADAKAFAARQTESGRRTEFLEFPGVGHAFFNDTRPEVYSQKSASTAWTRTLDHFRQNL